MQRTKGLSNIQTSYFDADAQSSKGKAPQVGDPLKVKSKGAPKKTKRLGDDGANQPMSKNGRPLSYDEQKKKKKKKKGNHLCSACNTAGHNRRNAKVCKLHP